MKIAITTIKYRIAVWKATPTVSGYAIALPPPFTHLRFCARKIGSEWVIEHYDTGMIFGGPVVSVGCDSKSALAYVKKWQIDGASLERAIAWLCRYLLHLRRTKKMAQLFGND